MNALYDAAIAGDVDAIAELEMKADIINQYDQYGRTILHVVSAKGNAEHVRFILREFANKNLLVKLGNQQETALVWAAYFGHTEVVEVLIEAARHLPPSAVDDPITSFQAYLRHADQDSETALHAAVKKRRIDVVKVFVEADPTDTHIQNNQGKTPMYIAVEEGYHEIVEMISTICTAPSLDGPDGSSAVRVKNLDQVNSPGGRLYTIMNRDDFYAAAIAGDTDAVAKLEIEADILNCNGETILHIESKNGNTEHVLFILRAFPHKNLLGKLNYDEETALHLAIVGGHAEVAEVIIEESRRHFEETSFQAYLRQGDYGLDTALHAAVMRGNTAIVKMLVEADPADRHTQNDEGKTPIYIAAEKGYTDIVKVLCSSCAAPSLDGPGGSTALHAAIKNHNLNSIEVVEGLIGAARHLPSLPSSDSDSSFQAFLRQVDEDMNTALHVAVMDGNLATAKLLVQADPSNRGIKNNNNETPFYLAVERGHADIAKMICTTCTAPINMSGPDGLPTTFHAAIKNLDEGRNEVRDVIKMMIATVKWRLISQNENLNEYEIYTTFAAQLFFIKDLHGQTMLELAVDRNYVEVIELILDVGYPYSTDEWIGDDFISLMPLIYKAKDKGYKKIVELLSRRYQAGAHLSMDLRNQAGLISAIRRRETETVSSLLDACDDGRLVTFVDKFGWTALHHAVYHEFNLVIKSIIETQKKFLHAFRYPKKVPTPFHVAVERGYMSTMILLFQLWPSWSCTYADVGKNGQNILHLAALKNKKEIIQDILIYCQEKEKDVLVNEQDNNGNTPLHLLIRSGCLVLELLRYRRCDIRVKNNNGWTPADMLYVEDQIIGDQVQIRLALDDIQIDKKDILWSPVLSSKRDGKDAILYKKGKLLIHEKHAQIKEDTLAIANCFADAIAGDAICKAALEMKADLLNEDGKNILHVESMRGDTERVRYIVRELAHKNLLVKLDGLKQTALHLAVDHGHTRVVEVLIDAARDLPSSSANSVNSFEDFITQAAGPMRNTAVHIAVLNNYVAIAELLLQADPYGSHVQNSEGKTPIYIAAEKGYKDILMKICSTYSTLSLDGPGGSTTALHALIHHIGQDTQENRHAIRVIIKAAKQDYWIRTPDLNFEALFKRTDELGRTVLELAVEKSYAHAVEIILIQDPAYGNGRGSKNHLMNLIYKAIDGKLGTHIVELLSEAYETGIDTVHKGVLNLILAIKRRDKGSVLYLLQSKDTLVTFADDEGWTPLHYAAYHQFVSVFEVIIKALNNESVYSHSTPFHVAAENGHTYTMTELMKLWPNSSSAYIATNRTGKNVLHLAAARNNKKMIQDILVYCPQVHHKQLLEQKDWDGNTPLHLLISNGCYVPELIKHKGLDLLAKNNKKWTPRDMLYLGDKITADQVQIKAALDHVQTNQPWKFWKVWNFRGKATEKETDIFESIVLPDRRERKDVLFNERKNELMDKKNAKMRKDLERYKDRTNTQIVVAALITTVTFTVGFTMPGGLHQSGEAEEGLVVLSKKTAFKAFMVTDALALLLSTSSLFFYFLQSIYEDPRQVARLNAASTGLNIVSVTAMMVTFITGTYVVLYHSPALAITVCTIGSLFFILVIVLLIKIVYDRGVKRNED